MTVLKIFSFDFLTGLLSHLLCLVILLLLAWMAGSMITAHSYCHSPILQHTDAPMNIRQVEVVCVNAFLLWQF